MKRINYAKISEECIEQEAGCFDCSHTCKGAGSRAWMLSHVKATKHTGWVSALPKELIKPVEEDDLSYCC